MIAYFKTILAPPVFDGDEDKTEIAGLLHALALITLTSALVYTIAFPILLPPLSDQIFLIAPAFPLLLAVLF
ncbi:MAG: hypothetical protein M1570_00770 [Chloroflexi bacterium]|nr:hypothetical protein [Chloroflexota bacterium]